MAAFTQFVVFALFNGTQLKVEINLTNDDKIQCFCCHNSATTKYVLCAGYSAPERCRPRSSVEAVGKQNRRHNVATTKGKDETRQW